MKKRLVAVVLSVMLGVICVAGCGGSAADTGKTTASDSAQPEAPEQTEAPSQTTKPEDKTEGAVLKIGVLDRTADEEVHIKFGEGMQKACKEAGVECLYSTPGEDMSLIRSTYDSYVAQGCNVIVDFLSSLETSQALADDCKRDGVYHICIDADPSEDSYFYGLSNGEAGEELGKYLVDYVNNKMDGKCDLLILMDSPSHGEDVAKRTEVPKQMLLDNQLITEDQVAYISLTNYDLESVRQEMTDFLTTHKDAQNVLMISFASSFNDAIYSASKAQGFDDKLNLFSYDGMDATINIFKSGEKSVTKGEVSSGMEKYGYGVLEIAQKLVNGESVEHKTYSDTVVMDPDNVLELHPE